MHRSTRVDWGLRSFVLRASEEFASGKLRYKIVAVLGTIVGLGVLDTVSGPDIAFSVFYLVPIALAACAGRAAVTLPTCALAAVTWLAADLWAGAEYSTPAIPIWNATSRLVVFVVVATLLGALRGSLLRAEELSRVDPLTGAANPRHFYETAERERLRAVRTRSPLSLVYIDLDNFKEVNDSAGHLAGDSVLCEVASTLQSNVRVSDLVGRLGGDEFAVLLPETPQAAAATVVSKLQGALRTVLHQCDGNVSASLGVATFDRAPSSVDDVVMAADRLMYAAKSGGKDTICAARS
jgi:diguanylate cyclase (GGDEF)-like protein